MIENLARFVARAAYKALRASWLIRRPVTLGVRLLLVRGNEVLLVKHTYRPGWFLPGGRPNRGESLDDTARREAYEEVGAEVERVELLGVVSHVVSRRSDHVVIFATEVFERNEMSSMEIDDVAWYSIDALPADTASETRVIVEQWRSGALGKYRVV